MDPITMGIVAGLPGAIKSTTGILQFLEGRKRARESRPMREIPQEVIQNLNQAQQLALEGMPEEQRNLFLQDIQRNQNQSVAQLGDRRAGIAGIPQIYQAQNDALNRLAVQDSQMRLANMQNLQGQRAEMGRQRDTQFQLNEFEPFLNRMRMAEGLIGAGMQNFMGGVTDTSKMMIDYDLYDKSMGGDGIMNFKRNNTQPNNFNQSGFDADMQQMINNEMDILKNRDSYNPLMNMG